MTLPRPTRKLTERIEPKIDTAPAPEPGRPNKYRRQDFRPSDVFRFDPLPDITIQELAYVVSVLWLDVHHDRFFSFPEYLQRHFRHLRHE